MPNASQNNPAGLNSNNSVAYVTPVLNYSSPDLNGSGGYNQGAEQFVQQFIINPDEFGIADQYASGTYTMPQANKNVPYTAYNLRPNSYYSLYELAANLKVGRRYIQGAELNERDDIKTDAQGSLKFTFLAWKYFSEVRGGIEHYSIDSEVPTEVNVFATRRWLEGDSFVFGIFDPTPPASQVLLEDEPIPVTSVPVIPTIPDGFSTTKPEVPEDTTTVQLLSSSTTQTSRDLGVLRTETVYGTGAQSPLSSVSLFFDYCQTFYLDPNLLDNSQSVSLTSVTLYFERKPHSINNQSGILNPGAYIFICKTNNDVPDLRNAYLESVVRLDYENINPSLSGVDPTIFNFSTPLTLETGKSYAIVINFEDPQFSLWTASQGRPILGTTTLCDGAYNFGKLYRASNYLEIDNDPQTLDDILKPLPATDLKFKIDVLDYDTTSREVELVNDDYEFIVVNNLRKEQDATNSFFIGDIVYQDFGNVAANVSFYASGNVSTTLSEEAFLYYPSRESSLPTSVPSYRVLQGNGTFFSRDVRVGDAIVITNGNPQDTFVALVSFILDDTRLIMGGKPPGNYDNIKYKVTAVGEMSDYLTNPNTFVLVNSNANERVRFIKDGVNYITINAGTAAYANTDTVIFSGNGAVNATAQIITYANGTISALNIVNPGYGFTTTPTASVIRSNGTLYSPSGAATFTPSIGAQLKALKSKSTADIVDITYYPITNFIPNLQFKLNGGQVTNPRVNFAYYDNDKQLYDVNDNNYVGVISQQSSEINNYNAVILSKSLEILNASTLRASSSEGKSSIIKFTINASNRYDPPELHGQLSSLYTFSNDINNDATNENTNFGNAVARHISKKITFDKNRYAEDIRVISTLYKPPGTDVKFYARVHNSKDEEAFDDKQWTELEFKDATFSGKTTSSLIKKDDYVELTYGFRAYPEITQVLDGVATVYAAAGNTTVTGQGTSFNTQLANGDMVVLYDPLFSNTTYAVAIVANTPVAGGFEINRAFENNSLASASLKVGKVTNKYTAFNDIHNDNVATYYSTSLTEFSTYDTFAIKIVPLANSVYIVPRINDVRAIGVSA